MTTTTTAAATTKIEVFVSAHFNFKKLVTTREGITARALVSEVIKSFAVTVDSEKKDLLQGLIDSSCYLGYKVNIPLWVWILPSVRSISNIKMEVLFGEDSQIVDANASAQYKFLGITINFRLPKKWLIKSLNRSVGQWRAALGN